MKTVIPFIATFLIVLIYLASIFFVLYAGWKHRLGESGITEKDKKLFRSIK